VNTPAANEIYAQIRANVAFEHMVAAVLAGAALAGAGLLLVNGASLLAKGAFGPAAALDITVGALTAAFLTFLIGFFAAVLIGLPLFLALERAKLRSLWPYLLAALIVNYAALALLTGEPDLVRAPAGAIALLPGLVIALIFGARIRPLWRAAAREEAEREANIVRLH
jgi:hypothetical protein